MPVIIKNGKVYGDRNITLTQAEYDALPVAEKCNGTVYYITDSSTSYPTASNLRYDTGHSVKDKIDELDEGLIVQFLSTGWTGSETVDGVTYATQTISVTSVSGHPIVGIVPISGTLPTSAEQDAFDSVEYFTANDTANTIKAYATSAPSDDFAVVVKGAR